MFFFQPCAMWDVLHGLFYHLSYCCVKLILFSCDYIVGGKGNSLFCLSLVVAFVLSVMFCLLFCCCKSGIFCCVIPVVYTSATRYIGTRILR